MHPLLAVSEPQGDETSLLRVRSIFGPCEPHAEGGGVNLYSIVDLDLGWTLWSSCRGEPITFVSH